MSWLHKALRRAMESQKDEDINILSEIVSECQEPKMGDFGQRLSKSTAETSFTYTQTTQLKMDEKLMQKNRIILPDVTHTQLIERYKILRAQIFKRGEEKHWRTIMITSLGQGEGKTLTAINLSMLIAREVHQTALLVDADMNKPSILNLFGCDKPEGLSDYLLKGVPVSELLVNPGIDSFTILPGGKPIQNTAELLRSDRMALLVKELKERYDDRYIIFDVPPLLMSTDAFVLSKHMDAVVLVIEAGKTSKKDLKKGWELLEWMNLIGVVLNKCALEKKTYYYK